MATHASTESVFKVYDGGKVYINSNVGVTYEVSGWRNNMISRLIYKRIILQEPDGWVKPGQGTPFTGNWIKLQERNKEFRGGK